MVSSRSIGMKYEREYEQVLREQGYNTQRVKGSTKWNKNVDFFGKWDILGFNKIHWVLVQVKSQFTTKELNNLKEWCEVYNPPNTRCYLVIRNKGRIKKGKYRWRLEAI